MAAQKLTYSKLLDELKPTLDAVSQLKYPIKTPMSFHLAVAENIEKIETLSKTFWDVRNKILTSLSEKDEKGQPKKELNANGQQEFVLTDESRIVWVEKLQELKSQEVKVNLVELERKHFEGVEGLMPAYFVGLLPILKK